MGNHLQPDSAEPVDTQTAAPAGFVKNLKPAMTPVEIELFKQIFRGKKSLVEYGCGGSTALALELGVQEIWSVDSSLDWLDRVKEHPATAPAVLENRLKLLHVDIGPVAKWGFPADKSKVENWPLYAAKVWDELGDKSQDIDIVLVDGRFRVACVLAALVFAKPDALIVVHDFTRDSYQAVREFCTVAALCDSLALLVRKPQLSPPRLVARLLEYSMDPR